MSDIPDAANLLAAARALLLDELLPALPDDRRYAGLMVANAMGIAAREHGRGAEALRDEAGRLRELLAAPTPPAGDIAGLRRALAAAIRAGAFDIPPQQTALIAHLARCSADQTAISNPKALRDSR